MAIKKIQLRGISRNPSDRMTEDGGVAESLNVYIDNDELAPINASKPANESIGLPEDSIYEPVYIHKTSQYEHLIALYNSSLYFIEDGEPKEILSFAGRLRDITHMGNVITVLTDARAYYLFYIKGEYKAVDLSEENLPKLSFVSLDQPAGAKDGVSHDLWYYDSYTVELHDQFNGEPNLNYEVVDEDDLATLTDMWGSYRSMIDHNLRYGCFSEPVMLRYGIRLYDGSYIWVSSPIMLGSALPKVSTSVIPFSGIVNKKDVANVFTAYPSSDNANLPPKTFVQIATPYKIGINVFRKEGLSGLRDIVSSVDVFLSRPINLYPEGSHRASGEYVETGGNDGVYSACWKYQFDPANSQDGKKIEEAVLAASNFFLIKRYTIDELPDTTDVITDDFLGENLLVKEQLDDMKVSRILHNADKADTYNGRTILSGVQESISRGIGVLNGQRAIETPDFDYSGISFGFAYNILSESLNIKDIGAKSGTIRIASDEGEYATDATNIVKLPSVPYAWVSHPNPNCDKVSVRVYGESDTPVYEYDIAMKPHPFLPCSYAFLGFGESLLQEKTEDTGFDDRDDEPISVSENKAIMSGSENPFVFSIASSSVFPSKVLGFAVATEPMSTAQFGQFPIYFFAEDGIYTTEINAEGNFGSAPTLISRDVCTLPSSIAQASTGVFFISDRGVMHISGRQVVCISENMNGRPYIMQDTAIAIIEGTEYNELIDKDRSAIYFKDFLLAEGNNSETQIAYDYQGQRIIVFNPYYDYQFVYMLKSQTWHRCTFGRINTKINKYPDCIVIKRESKRVGDIIRTLYYAENLSTLLDVDGTPQKAMIVTRPFDLDEPDVLKAIKDVRMRGQFPKGAVKFILQGSQDGINFYTISTLRGKAWKLFRMIILANLDTTDRISWIDVMYETKFTNRLR